jgi:hypothetical protein
MDGIDVAAEKLRDALHDLSGCGLIHSLQIAKQGLPSRWFPVDGNDGNWDAREGALRSKLVEFWEAWDAAIVQLNVLPTFTLDRLNDLSGRRFWADRVRRALNSIAEWPAHSQPNPRTGHGVDVPCIVAKLQWSEVPDWQPHFQVLAEAERDLFAVRNVPVTLQQAEDAATYRDLTQQIESIERETVSKPSAAQRQFQGPRRGLQKKFVDLAISEGITDANILNTRCGGSAENARQAMSRFAEYITQQRSKATARKRKS